jgi:hypothetical protein
MVQGEAPAMSGGAVNNQPWVAVWECMFQGGCCWTDHVSGVIIVGATHP